MASAATPSSTAGTASGTGRLAAMAPASPAMANVRIPAGSSLVVAAWLRSRSSPMANATPKATEKESKEDIRIAAVTIVPVSSMHAGTVPDLIWRSRRLLPHTWKRPPATTRGAATRWPSVTSRPNGARPAGQRGQYCALPG
uniref:Uncharacterized protein n=1 Tax=Ralstonia solanacearum CFBP2957 TaxID=859656 RepID=D8P4D7_RALSL|nr:exported protein of unknown function [Ralstonia solanacearum CFBP2957]